MALCHKIASYDRLDTSVEGYVDHLSPAIEASFSILGKNRPTLTLRLILERWYLPGVQMLFDEQMSDAYRWDSMALPDLVERPRRDYSNSRVQVLWEW